MPPRRGRRGRDEAGGEVFARGADAPVCTGRYSTAKRGARCPTRVKRPVGFVAALVQNACTSCGRTGSDAHIFSCSAMMPGAALFDSGSAQGREACLAPDRHDGPHAR